MPRVTVVLRKAFGGAYITMNSKDLGADYVFAWPGAEIGVMGARPAVGIMHRRELAASEDPVATRDGSPPSTSGRSCVRRWAASTGYVDELIEPERTRSRLVWAYRSLQEATMKGRETIKGRDGGSVLLTGATGFVGMELLARYLERGRRRVVTLVRASERRCGSRAHRPRARNLFGGRADHYADRVDAIAGELTAPRLGLDDAGSPSSRKESIRSSIARRPSRSSCHSIRRVQSISRAPATCLSSLTSLAQRGGLERYGHVSTAYVAGTHSGSFAECDLNVGQEFRNSYEQSKFEAEELVQSRDGLPFTIMRPSIVVGDRRSGWTAAFNVLYWPLRAFARGLFTAVPGVPTAPVDVVSIDYVSRRDLRTVRIERRGWRDLPPDGRRGREHDPGDCISRQPLLRSPAPARALAYGI